MDEDPGELLVGLMMAVFGIVGLLLSAHARDDEMFVFGLSLAGFSAAFILGLIRVHYDHEAPEVLPRTARHV